MCFMLPPLGLTCIAQRGQPPLGDHYVLGYLGIKARASALDENDDVAAARRDHMHLRALDKPGVSRCRLTSAAPFTRETVTVSPACAIESGIAGICGP